MLVEDDELEVADALRDTVPIVELLVEWSNVGDAGLVNRSRSLIRLLNDGATDNDDDDEGGDGSDDAS
jgi:hypothetical protein